MTDSVIRRQKESIQLLFPYHLFNLHSHFEYKTMQTLAKSVANRRDNIAYYINNLNHISTHTFVKKKRNYDELFFIAFALKYMEQKKAKQKLNKINFKGSKSFNRAYSIIKPKPVAFYGLIDDYIEKLKEKQRNKNKNKKIADDYARYKKLGLIPIRNIRMQSSYMNSFNSPYQTYIEKNRKALPSVDKNEREALNRKKKEKDNNKEVRIGMLKINRNRNNTMGNDNYTMNKNDKTLVKWEDNNKSISFRPGKTSSMNDKFFLTTTTHNISSTQFSLNTTNSKRDEIDCNYNSNNISSERKSCLKPKSILRKKVPPLNDIISIEA